MSVCLVTGCAGFIGSHLAERLLSRGEQVIGIDCFTDFYAREIKERNLAEAMKHSSFTIIEKDILSMDDFPEVDYVFHHAAQAGVRKSWGANFDVYTRNNIEASQKLLEFYRHSQIKKFVYASSSSVYGNAVLPFTEDVVPKPYSPYGVTKLAGEHLCQLYHQNYGLPAVSLRYFTVYGPRQRPDMAICKFVRAALNGDEIVIFGDGTQTRDFTYVSDIVEANTLAADSALEGAVLNVGCGNPLTVNDLSRLIGDAVGKPLKIKYERPQHGDVGHTRAGISKAGDELGWEPGVNIEDGIQEFVTWFREGRERGEC